jgi:hypothetical protein
MSAFDRRWIKNAVVKSSLGDTHYQGMLGRVVNERRWNKT